MRDQLEYRKSNAPQLIRKTPILEADLSIRALNAVRNLIQEQGLDAEDPGRKDSITVEEFYEIFNSAISTRNFGRHAKKEMEELFTKAGLKGDFEKLIS